MSDVQWISSCQSTPKARLYTSLPYGASYQPGTLREPTYAPTHIPFSPVQCIWELPVSHPTPSGNLTTLPVQPQNKPRSLVCTCFHITSDQPHGIAWQSICHLIRWISRKTRMLQLLLQLLLLQQVTSITNSAQLLISPKTLANNFS